MDKSSNEITNYFSVTKNIEWVNVPVDKCTQNANQIYKKCLFEKTNQLKCHDTNCESRKLELQFRLKEEKEKFSDLERALETCLSIIDTKNRKIAQLTKGCDIPKKPTERSTPVSISKSKPNTSLNTSQVGEKNPLKTPPTTPTNHEDLFASHGKHFSSEQLAKLRTFGKDMKEDSTFILTIMRTLYEDDFESLKGT